MTITSAKPGCIVNVKIFIFFWCVLHFFLRTLLVQSTQKSTSLATFEGRGPNLAAMTLTWNIASFLGKNKMDKFPRATLWVTIVHLSHQMKILESESGTLSFLLLRWTYKIILYCHSSWSKCLRKTSFYCQPIVTCNFIFNIICCGSTREGIGFSILWQTFWCSQSYFVGPQVTPAFVHKFSGRINS